MRADRARGRNDFMHNQRGSRRSGGVSSGTSDEDIARADITRDRMLREDETVRAESAASRDWDYDEALDNEYWHKKGPGPQVMSADTLQGDKVLNNADENLGEITDIMIDVPTGRVAYAVLSVGGILGIGDKLFAIPWHALTLDTENKCFRLDVPKERLKEAPGFDKDDWPTMADQRWAQEVHSFYNARPYWY
jgi:sporulation protein YlmC with PRC-barrel domain